MQLILSALLLASAPTEAQPAVQSPAQRVELALEWSSPEDCPTRASLIESIRVYLPALVEPPIGPAPARLRVRARVESVGDTFAVELEMAGVDTQMRREFSDRDCAVVTEGVALIVAVALDPVAVSTLLSGSTRASEPEPAPAPQPELAPQPEPQPVSRPELVSRASDHAGRAHRPRIGLRVAGGGGYGPTQAGYASVAGGVAVFDGRWRAQVDGGWFIPRRRSLDDGRAAQIQGWWLGARGCFVPALEPVEFPLCAGFEAGQVLGSGVPPTQNVNSDSFPWLAGHLSPGLTWAVLRRLGVGVETSLLIPIGRGAFEIDGNELDPLAPIGLRASLVIELRL